MVGAGHVLCARGPGRGLLVCLCQGQYDCFCQQHMRRCCWQSRVVLAAMAHQHRL
jgi:hypothetical protein